jgi:hypothetical protein
MTGGEGGILLPPLPASADECYTSVIIPCVLAAYKLFTASPSVSTVSPICCDFQENGITGIRLKPNGLDGQGLDVSVGVSGFMGQRCRRCAAAVRLPQ